MLLSGGVAELDYYDDQGFPQVNQTENAVAADTISTDEVWPSSTNNFNLSGASITLGVWEGGAVLSSHQEFRSCISYPDDAANLYGISSHATAVAGTMIAAGTYNTAAKGMSYEANLYSYHWDDYLADLAAASTNEVYISNHSWGWTRGWSWNSSKSIWYWYGNPDVSPIEDYKFGLYDEQARERDEFVYTAVFCLPVWSAGNDRNDASSTQPINHIVWKTGQNSELTRNEDGFDNGFDTIGSRKTAKNILTVGAVRDIVGGYSESNDVVMSSFSGFGPTDDGRIKPDIVANGVGLTTLYGTSDSAYTNYSGTSFSAPTVSGSLGLLQQLQAQLHGTNDLLLASTYKGLLIHTADEAGSSGGPDYRFGWGLMNTLTAAQLMSTNATYNSKPHIKEVILPDGEQIEFQVAVADTGMPLRVTLCWTDPPGPLPPQNELDPTNRVLVNDLDLRLIDPIGTTNFP